jgi:hypothetical protein
LLLPGNRKSQPFFFVEINPVCSLLYYKQDLFF